MCWILLKVTIINPVTWRWTPQNKMKKHFHAPQFYCVMQTKRAKSSTLQYAAVTAETETTDNECMSLDRLNPLMNTTKQRTTIQRYGDWYTGHWWVGCNTWYREERPGLAAAQPSPLLIVPNVTAHPSMAGVPTSYHLMWNYNHLYTHCKGLNNRNLQWRSSSLIITTPS